MDSWPKQDALDTYHEACRLAREGHSGLREWFSSQDADVIYFLDVHGKEIKVGYTAANRISTHKQNGFTTLAVLRGGRAEERELHKALASAGWLSRGKEWYKPVDGLWKYIDWLLSNGYAAPGEDASHLPTLPMSVWIYSDPLPFTQSPMGQLNIFGAMPPKERVKRHAKHAYNLSLSDDWYTTKEWIDLAREAMGSIDLDPATNAFINSKWIKAPHYYTKEINGLSPSHPWFGNVWLNPPYGDQAGLFFKRLVTEYTAGNVQQCVTCCSSNSITAQWFHDTLARVSSIYYVHRGRIVFVKPGSFKEGDAPNQGTLLSYVGRNENRFVEVFSRAEGMLMRRIWNAA